MDGRPAKTTSLIRSKYALRALVTGITFTTFTGMSAFAAAHVRNAAAPLKPSADGTSAAAAATPTPFATPRTRARTTTTRVPTTPLAPRTTTRSS